MAQSLHIYHYGRSQPVAIPVTFYLSPEIMSDETISVDRLAEILHRDLVFALEQARKGFDGTRVEYRA